MAAARSPTACAGRSAGAERAAAHARQAGACAIAGCTSWPAALCSHATGRGGAMARRRLIALATALSLTACGGGGGGGGNGSGGPGGGGTIGPGGAGPGGALTASDTSVNAARVADLNALRGQCGGTA